MPCKEEEGEANFDFKENRFFIEGEGSIKHKHNNGHLAADPKLAAYSFLNALEKIPKTIEKYQADTDKIAKDLPVLQELVKSTWRREDELKEPKSEFSALDRKIQLSLKPIEQGDSRAVDMVATKGDEVEKNRQVARGVRM
ncbi:hypothetical protein AwDysgo_20930 [Bacteroidales bacterium]|nr:hypothetical protein AwDysgo_20930 [Bacteroidales bacterium]